MNRSVGIRSVGIHLPETVRPNDWWPQEMVDGWRDSFEQRLAAADGPASESERLIREAMLDFGDDPFRGSVRRHVLPDDMESSDMEVAAARDALERANCSAGDVDLLLSSALVPDYLATNNACTIQHALGISRSCLTISLDVAGNAFSQQLAIAESMIATGRATTALLTQSCAHSRVLEPDDPHAPWFGDAATALVVGPVSANRGLLGRADRTDGALQGSLVVGVPGGRWHDEGRAVIYNASMAATRSLIGSLIDVAKETLDEALDDAGASPQDIDFYACHQAFPWLRRVTQRHAKLDRARFVDTFSEAANVAAANVPFVLATAERRGTLRDGDLVATFTGGSGITWSSMVMRWGC